MDTFQQHEIFEIEVLEVLKNAKFLEPLVFGGGTMLRLCFDLKRYSADLDFWFVKPTPEDDFFINLQQVLDNQYDLLDSQRKHYTLLFEIRSSNYPKRLKIEIRRGVNECDFQDRIAFSQYSNKQVLLRVHTLKQTMNNKIKALLERGEPRDGFDIESIIRKGVSLPQLSDIQKKELINRIKSFKNTDFKVKLGSILESGLRQYYIENRFSYLMEKLHEV